MRDHFSDPSRQKHSVEPGSIGFYARSFERAFFYAVAAREIRLETGRIFPSNCYRSGEKYAIGEIGLEISVIRATLFPPFRPLHALPALTGECFFLRETA